MARKKTLDENQLTDTFYYILLSLINPTHGYVIMQKVEEISNGTFEIGPASLYTSLKKMLNGGLLALQDTGHNDKKVYSLTPVGKELLLKDYHRRKELVLHGKKILEGENYV